MKQQQRQPEMLQLVLFPELLPSEPGTERPRADATGETRERLLRSPAPVAPPAAPRILPPPPAAVAVASPPRRGAEELLQVLVHHLGAGLASLVLTSNHTRIISARPERDGALHLRVHRSFAEAPPEIVAALVVFLKGPKRHRGEALQQIRQYFDLWRQHSAPPHQPRRVKLEPRGEHFDLEAIRDAVNRDYFENRLEVAITWGKSASPPRRRKRGFSVRLGSFHERDNLVRIHPVLDRAEVPHLVVESIVHHEMVHAVVPIEKGRGRRVVHSAEFRRQERLYRYHAEAEIWLQANIERLAKLR